jgi:hypothetical protein
LEYKENDPQSMVQMPAAFVKHFFSLGGDVVDYGDLPEDALFPQYLFDFFSETGNPVPHDIPQIRGPGYAGASGGMSRDQLFLRGTRVLPIFSSRVAATKLGARDASAARNQQWLKEKRHLGDNTSRH